MTTKNDKKKENDPLSKTGEWVTKYREGLTRRNFIKYSAGTIACVSLGSLIYGCGSGKDAPPVAGYPIDADVYTTLQKTVQLSQSFSETIAPQDLQNISEYDSKGYGVWEDGGPLPPARRLDIMSSGYDLPADNNPSTLLRYFAVADIHTIDKESPSQLIYIQQAKNADGTVVNPKAATNTSIYSPTMLFSTHVLDAAIQTVNALHKQSPIDFGISLGDTSNSAQYNELRWYIDVIDGKVITPSSGAHLGADSIDYQKPYKAAGLNPSIPWYQTIGNHDHFWLGALPFDDGDMRKTCISDEVLAMGDAIERAANLYDDSPPLYYMGVIDGSTLTGKVIKGGKVGDPGFTSPPKVVADKDRRALTKTEWVQEFFKTATYPVGHGFNLVPSGQEDGFACYSFTPKSDIPLKVIVLDDTQREDDGATSIHGRGFLDEARWAWLKDELRGGDEANQLMIIAAHIPIGVSPHKSSLGGKDTYMDWFDNSDNPASMQNAVTLAELIAELHSHPNLILWMAGHRHVNIVKAFVSDDPSAPERGFWHVETSSLHDFPQQMRLFEIKLNSDYSISIVTTNIDPAVKEGTPAWTARKYAVAAQQIVHTNLMPSYPSADPTLPAGLDPSVEETKAAMDPTIGSYNAELLVELSPAMKAYLQTLFP